jgi:phage gp46-like protein
MAGDIDTRWYSTRGDWTVAGPDLASGNDIVTAVLISLFTDAEAHPDDVIPDGSGDPRGWWGDDDTTRIGSRLWLIERAKRTDATLELAKGYIEEALQWLIDDGAVDSVDVYVEWTRAHTLGARVTVYRANQAMPIEFVMQPTGVAEVTEYGWNTYTQRGEWQPRQNQNINTVLEGYGYNYGAAYGD